MPIILNPNKLLKEEFVSNLAGCSLLEIAVLSTVVPVFFVLRRSAFFNRSSDGGLVHFLLSIINEFIFTNLPSILFLTVLSHWLYPASLLLLLLLYAAYRVYPPSITKESAISLRDYLLSYRVLMTTVTCLCILAVDFPIFPRRYAKAETYGSGLMDLGVGSFTLGNALVSRHARGSSQLSWIGAVRSVSPLLLLGFGRLFSTRSVDYQVHVGEYGVHWNFFFTLAAVSILTSLFNVRVKHAGTMGLLILLGYQSWLLCGNNTFLLSEDRGDDLVSKNKEGLYSIFGYWGMYLVGTWLGNHLFFGNTPSSGFKRNGSAKLRVWLLSLTFWFLTVILDKYVEKISRRMCNMAYVALVLAQNLQVLAVLMLSDFVNGSKLLRIEDAFNRNLLVLFLMANVLTGLVNLSVDTMFIWWPFALLIILTYALLLTLAAAIAHFFGLKVKFW